MTDSPDAHQAKRPDNLEDPTPRAKLYANERADKARNQAIGVLGFVALVLSIASGIGAFSSAQSYIDYRIEQGALAELEKRAEAAALAAETSARGAEETEVQISNILNQLRTQMPQLRLGDAQKWEVGRSMEHRQSYIAPSIGVVILRNEGIYGDAVGVLSGPTGNLRYTQDMPPAARGMSQMLIANKGHVFHVWGSKSVTATFYPLELAW